MVTLILLLPLDETGRTLFPPARGSVLRRSERHVQLCGKRERKYLHYSQQNPGRRDLGDGLDEGVHETLSKFPRPVRHEPMRDRGEEGQVRRRWSSCDTPEPRPP